MTNFEDLLKPVAGDKPCGEDFTYHPTFQKLEALALGKPETQFSPAEEPQWKEVRDAAIEVLGQSKHLGAGVLLTKALLKTNGLEGLRAGFALVRGLTETYWAGIYPKLDPDDNNDPTERLNILNNFAGNSFCAELRQVVLCESPSFGRFTLQRYIAAKERSEKPDASPPGAGPDMNQIQAAFRDGGHDAAKASAVLVQEVIGHSRGIDGFLDSTLGAGRGVNFESLYKLLDEMKQALGRHSGDGEVAEAAEAAEAGSSATSRPAAGSGVSVPGTIRSRADVIKALDLICDYYRTHEPSSPVPLILQRAQRLVDKDFMTIVNDLTPESLKQIEVITGAKPKE